MAILAQLPPFFFRKADKTAGGASKHAFTNRFYGSPVAHHSINTTKSDLNSWQQALVFRSEERQRLAKTLPAQVIK